MKKEVYKRFPSFFFLWDQFPFPIFFCNFYPFRNETKSTYLVEKNIIMEWSIFLMLGRGHFLYRSSSYFIQFSTLRDKEN